jgi:hypothetical protein
VNEKETSADNLDSIRWPDSVVEERLQLEDFSQIFEEFLAFVPHMTADLRLGLESILMRMVVRHQQIRSGLAVQMVEDEERIKGDLHAIIMAALDSYPHLMGETPDPLPPSRL